jgi:hypothetical protein
MWATWMVVHMASFQQAGISLEHERCETGDEYGNEDERHQRDRERISG